jgi:hypothetical protein
VTDVRRLVGIDGGVLDDRFGRRRCGWRGGGEAIEQETSPLEEEIQISVGRRCHPGNPFERAEGTGDFLCNRPRCLAQPAGELEGNRRPEVAKLAIGRVLEDDRRRLRGIGRVELGEDPRDVRAHAVVNRKDHRDLGFRLRLDGSCGTLFTSDP